MFHHVPTVNTINVIIVIFEKQQQSYFLEQIIVPTTKCSKGFILNINKTVLEIFFTKEFQNQLQKNTSKNIKFITFNK